jgi:hypothetical protein
VMRGGENPVVDALTAAPRMPHYGGAVVSVSMVAAATQGAPTEHTPTRLWCKAVAAVYSTARIS